MDSATPAFRIYKHWSSALPGGQPTSGSEHIMQAISRRSLVKAAGTGIALTGFAASSAAPAAAAQAGQSQDSVLFHNGSVLTMDPACPRASAVLVRGNRIAAVGGAELKRAAKNATRRIDLRGGTLLPGINDSHFHFAQYALTRPPLTVDLSSAISITQMQAAIREAVQRQSDPNSWIKCFGLDFELLSPTERANLNRRDLDAVSAAHPVAIREASSHITIVNSRALELAGIRGGEDPGVALDPDGTPTGVLYEAAQNLINGVLPPYSAQEHRTALAQAFGQLHRTGLTSYTEPVIGPGMGNGTGLGMDTLEVYLELARSGKLPMRVDIQLAPVGQSGGRAAQFREFLDTWTPPSGIDSRWLRIESVKAFADGLDDPLNTGGDSPEERRQELFDIAQTVHERGFQLGVHVIGPEDTGITVEALLAAQLRSARPDPRHYLIHGYWISENSLRAAAQGGIGLNMQPSFFVRGVPPTVPGRALLPYRSALDVGVVTMASSDAPVAAPDWREHVALLTTRRNLDGNQTSPEQKIRLTEALGAYTSQPAWQNRAEQWKGTVSVGKVADLCLLDRDLQRTDPARIPEVQVTKTMIDGKFVYEA